jgi:hypothetical protein
MKRFWSSNLVTLQGWIQDFKLGGAHLKKLRRAEGGAKIFGVFRVKNHDFTPKKIIFSPILGGGGAPGAPPGSAPALAYQKSTTSSYIDNLRFLFVYKQEPQELAVIFSHHQVCIKKKHIPGDVKI